MLDNVKYIAGGVATGVAISFGTEFLINLAFKRWELAVVSGPSVSVLVGTGLYLRDFNNAFSIATAITGGLLLARGATYILEFRRQFQSGKALSAPAEINTMRGIVESLTPREKGLVMPGMVGVKNG